MGYVVGIIATIVAIWIAKYQGRSMCANVSGLALTVKALAVAVGLIGAVLWYLSARVKYPERLVGTNYTNAVAVDTKPLEDAVKRSARLNKWAAGFTAAAVLLSALDGTICLN